MKDFIRQRLLEAIKSGHWIKDSYPIRVADVVDQIGEEGKKEVDEKIAFIEGLEFIQSPAQKLGVWLYVAPVTVRTPIDNDKPGHILLAIINNNNMTTLYWKHKYEGQYDFDITFDELKEFSESEYYDATTKPISISNIKKWKKSKLPKVEPVVNTNKYKKIKLSNGEEVKYYTLLNKFETLDGQPINITSIYRELPFDDEVMLDLFKSASDDEKYELINQVPSHLSAKAEELFEQFKKKRK